MDFKLHVQKPFEKALSLITVTLWHITGDVKICHLSHENVKPQFRKDTWSVNSLNII